MRVCPRCADPLLPSAAQVLTANALLIGLCVLAARSGALPCGLYTCGSAA